MNSLGYTPKPPKKSNGGATPVTIVSGDEADRKPQYPRLELNGEQAEAAGLDKCTIGEEYELTIRIKATRLGGYSYDSSNPDKPAAEFQVLSAGDVQEVESSEEEDDTDEEDDESPAKDTSGKPASRVKSPRESGFKDGYR